MEKNGNCSWLNRRAAAATLIALAGVAAFFAGRGPKNAAAQNSPPASYPLITIVRDFNSGSADFQSHVMSGARPTAGNVSTTLDGTGAPVYTGGGKVVDSPARDSKGRTIPPGAVKAHAVSSFSISGDRVVANEPMAAKITVIGSELYSGNLIYPVTTQILANGSTFEPFGPYNSPTTGNVDDKNNPRYTVLPVMIQPGSYVAVNGKSWEPVSGNQASTVDSGWKTLMEANSSAGSAQVIALRNGDTVPTVAGFGSQTSVATMLSTTMDASGKIKLKDNQVVYLFELYTSNQSNSAFDLQDLVVLVELASDPSYFNTTTTGTTGGCLALSDTAARLGSANSGSITSSNSFSQWFTNVSGQNLAAKHTLKMMLDPATGVYSYSTPDLHPIDDMLYGNMGAAHNRGFTMVIDAEMDCKACGGQFIEVAGDGDAWLFVDGKLVMDMGTTSGSGSGGQYLEFDRLELGDKTVRVQLFYAQRGDSAAFTLRTNVHLRSAKSVDLPPVSGLYD
ncbi:MAG: hypothetical protein AB7Q00_05920 [Phycisphaerales bacterium]